MDDGENSRKVKGAGPNKNNIKLSFTKTIGIMDKRKQQCADVSQAAVKEGADEEEERRESKRNYEAEEKYRATIDKTKVPIYGTLRVHQKVDDAARFFSANMNGMIFW